MKRKSSTRTRHVTIIALISLLILTTSISINKTIIPCSQAENPTKPWNITLTIGEKNGTRNSVIFGEEINASDGQDVHDIPAPPMPPTLPTISVWFETPFPLPYDKLIKEFKYVSSANVSWNLSILWLPAPGNSTSTNITLIWDPFQILKNPDKTLFLYENSTILTNMLTSTSYTFITNGALHRFQIICQTQPSDNYSEQISIPIIPVVVSILVIFIGIIIVFLFLNKKKKNSFEKWKEQDTPLQINEKPKINKKPKTNKKPQTKRKSTKKQKR